MVFGLSARSMVLFSMLWSVAAFAAVTPYPPYPGAKASPAFKVTVDGQPVFVHRFLTYDQFQFMDYASFSMTGKVRVTVTNLVGEMNVLTCDIRPLAYGIKPQIEREYVQLRPRPATLSPRVPQRSGVLRRRWVDAVCRTAREEPSQTRRSERGQHHGLQSGQYGQDRRNREDQSGHQRRLRQAWGRRALFSPRASTWRAHCS